MRGVSVGQLLTVSCQHGTCVSSIKLRRVNFLQCFKYFSSTFKKLSYTLSYSSYFPKQTKYCIPLRSVAYIHITKDYFKTGFIKVNNILTFSN